MSWYSMLYFKDEAQMKDRAECSEKVGARFEKLRLVTTEYCITVMAEIFQPEMQCEGIAIVLEGVK